MSQKVTDNKQPYTIEFIREQDHELVMEFVRKFYLQDAPLNKCLQTYPCQEAEQWCSKMLPRNCSFKAVDESGRIIGVYLNTPISSTDHFAPDTASCTNASLLTELKFFEYIDLHFNLWERFPNAKNAFEAGVVSVDPEYRGMGIAKKLTQRTLEYAEEAGYPLVVCHCSSHLTALVCSAVGFEEVFRMPYADYVVDGKRPLQPEHPHKDFAIYVKLFSK